MKSFIILSILVIQKSLLAVDAFAPLFPISTKSRQATSPSTFKKYSQESSIQNTNPYTVTRRSSSELYWGILVPVPDDFFTITGISLGFAYTILRSWNRVTVENVAWENRLDDARMAKLDDEDEMNPSAYTELELRKIDAEASKSAYGPDSTMSGRERKSQGRRVQTLDDEYYDEDEDEDQSDRVYNMTDEQINEFEETYGVQYDPYYDEPYTVDELPDDISFVEDKVYGDRRYEDGEIFYRDESNNNLYWRQGGRPRLKQFWELI